MLQKFKSISNVLRKRKAFVFLFLYMLGLTASVHAGLFEDLNKLNTETFNAAHDTSGLMLRLVISNLPPLLFLVVPIGTFVYQNRKTEADKEDKMKIALWVSGSSIAGYLAGMVFIYLIGMGTFINHGGGDKSLDVMSRYWASGVAGIKYDDFKKSSNFKSANKSLSN